MLPPPLAHPGHPRRRVAPLAAALTATLAALAGLGACADGPTAAAPAVAHFAKASTKRPKRVANAVRYRDTGAKPSVGRAGVTTVTSRALLGRDGRTTVELTTGALDATTAAPGQVAKLQVKRYSPQGRLIGVDNYNAPSATGYAAVTAAGLARGARVELQAHVKGAGTSNGTDVVTVVDTVVRRPDLRVRLDAPDQAAVLTTVVISAVVTEANGDVGARGNCVLAVDGAEADRSDGIWVADGGVVGCRFVHKFTSVGAHRLRVSVQGVAPADDNPADNAAEGTIAVRPYATAMTYSADAYQKSGSAVDNYASTLTWRSGPDAGTRETTRSADTTTSDVYQSASLSADAPFGVPFATGAAEFALATGGRTVRSGAIPRLAEETPTADPDGYTYAYADGDEAQGSGEADYEAYGVSVQVYSSWGPGVDSLGRREGSTSVYFSWSSEEVVYVSHHWEERYDGRTGVTTRDTYIDRGEPNGLVPFGADVRLRVALSAGPRNLFTADALVPLERAPAWGNYESPTPTCNESDFGSVVINSCGSGYRRYTESWGSAYSDAAVQ